MGYIRHHAIVVTGPDHTTMPQLRQAWDEARRIFGDRVSPIVRSQLNAYSSFFVAPDGSKEGWQESADGDERRNAFIAWLDRCRYEDGSSALDWLEVEYGGDGDDAVVARDEVRQRSWPDENA